MSHEIFLLRVCLLRKESGESSLSSANLLSLPYYSTRRRISLCIYLDADEEQQLSLRPRFELLLLYRNLYAISSIREMKYDTNDAKKLFPLFPLDRFGEKAIFEEEKRSFRRGKQSSSIRSCNRINYTNGNTLW